MFKKKLILELLNVDDNDLSDLESIKASEFSESFENWTITKSFFL